MACKPSAPSAAHSAAGAAVFLPAGGPFPSSLPPPPPPPPDLPPACLNPPALPALPALPCAACSNGGSIGWISRGQTVPEFEEAAYSTAVGGLAMAETRFGVHLLTVTGER